MAKFNPEANVSPTQIPSGLGYSQGIGTNETFKTLFQGVSSAASAFAQGQDDLNKYNIYKDALGGSDEVRSVFGVQAAENTYSGKTPAAITKGQNDLAVLTKAYQAGTISETYYYTKLNDVVKGLRSKYPGYEAEIDNTIQNITGVTPANAIVASIRRDAEAATAGQDREANDWYQFQKQYQDEIRTFFPGWKGIGDTQYSKEQIYNGVATVLAERSKLAQEKATLERDNLKGQANYQQSLDYANNYASTISNQTVRGGLSALGKDFPAIQKILTDVQTGARKLDEQTILEITQGLNQLKMQTEFKVIADLQKPPTGGGKSVWDTLKPADREAVKTNSTALIDVMIEAVTGQNIGLLKGITLAIEAGVNTETLNFLKSAPMAKQLLTLQKAMGQTNFEIFMGKILTSDDAPAALKALDQTFQTYLLSGAVVPPVDPVTQKPNPVTIQGIDATTKSNPKLSKDSVSQFTNTSLKIALDKSTDPATASALFKVLYEAEGGFSLSLFDEAEGTKIYAKLANAQVGQRIKQVSDATSDPKLWNSYARWTYDNFDLVTKRLMNTILEGQKAYPGLVTATMSPASGQFILQMGTPTNRPAPNPFVVGNPSSNDALIKSAQQKLVDQYNELNFALSSLHSVMELDGQAESFIPFLQLHGFPVAGPEQQGMNDGTDMWTGADENGEIQLAFDNSSDGFFPDVGYGTRMERDKDFPASGTDVKRSLDMTKKINKDLPSLPTPARTFGVMKLASEPVSMNTAEAEPFQMAAAILKKEEGYRDTAYWDVNAHRAGYGSDTYTDAQGNVKRVTRDTRITREDAERDLSRRIPQFAEIAQKGIGEPWDMLPANAQAGLISVAYNYGRIPTSVRKAAAEGDVQAIADAVSKLSANPSRRKREAAIIRGETQVAGNFFDQSISAVNDNTKTRGGRGGVKTISVPPDMSDSLGLQGVGPMQGYIYEPGGPYPIPANNNFKFSQADRPSSETGADERFTQVASEKGNLLAIKPAHKKWGQIHSEGAKGTPVPLPQILELVNSDDVKKALNKDAKLKSKWLEFWGANEDSGEITPDQMQAAISRFKTARDFQMFFSMLFGFMKWAKGDTQD